MIKYNKTNDFAQDEAERMSFVIIITMRVIFDIWKVSMQPLQ
ncbi:hypothetical protein [Runella rosea]|nr:hypothetical protein [Runella rosea]